MFRTKILSDELFLHFSFESSEFDRVFNYLHDSEFYFSGLEDWFRNIFGRHGKELTTLTPFTMEVLVVAPQKWTYPVWIGGSICLHPTRFSGPFFFFLIWRLSCVASEIVFHPLYLDEGLGPRRVIPLACGVEVGNTIWTNKTRFLDWLISTSITSRPKAIPSHGVVDNRFDGCECASGQDLDYLKALVRDLRVECGENFKQARTNGRSNHERLKR